MKPIKLTPSQIRELDELSRDRIANDATLNVALRYHSNYANTLAKQEREMWDNWLADNNLPDGDYEVDRIEGAPCIVERDTGDRK